MSKSNIKLYDSTLRDGAQTKGVNFSLDDKFKIFKILSDIGIDYIYHSDIYTLFFKDTDEIHNTHCTGFLIVKCFR